MRLLCVLAFLPYLSYAQSEPNGAGLDRGSLPDRWASGGPNCDALPKWQVHQYNENFYILREPVCANYEKPFLFLFFGSERALLLDPGAGDVDTAEPVKA